MAKASETAFLSAPISGCVMPNKTLTGTRICQGACLVPVWVSGGCASFSRFSFLFFLQHAAGVLQRVAFHARDGAVFKENGQRALLFDFTAAAQFVGVVPAVLAERRIEHRRADFQLYLLAAHAGFDRQHRFGIQRHALHHRHFVIGQFVDQRRGTGRQATECGRNSHPSQQGFHVVCLSIRIKNGFSRVCLRFSPPAAQRKAGKIPRAAPVDKVPIKNFYCLAVGRREKFAIIRAIFIRVY